MSQRPPTPKERKFFAMDEPTIYTGVKIQKNTKGIWKITITHKKGGWEGSSNFHELHPVGEYLVLMYITSPKAVFLTVQQAVNYFTASLKCPVTVII